MCCIPLRVSRQVFTTDLEKILGHSLANPFTSVAPATEANVGAQASTKVKKMDLPITVKQMKDQGLLAARAGFVLDAIVNRKNFKDSNVYKTIGGDATNLFM